MAEEEAPDTVEFRQMVESLVEGLKPFLAGVVLAFATLVCFGLIAYIQHRLDPSSPSRDPAYMEVLFNVIHPWYLLYFVLFGVVLFPIAYYLSRPRWPVTPPRYALMGMCLAVALVAVLVVAISIGNNWPLWQTAAWLRLNQLMIRALLTGACCGVLFAWMMRDHYQRYRHATNEVT